MRTGFRNHGYYGHTFVGSRVLSGIALLAVIGLVVTFIREINETNFTTPTQLTGTIIIASAALLWVLLSFTAYDDTHIPYMATALVDAVFLIPYIVAVVVLGGPLRTIECSTLSESSGNETISTRDLNSTDTSGNGTESQLSYTTFAGSDKTTCYKLEVTWGLMVTLSILFVLSGIAAAFLFLGKRRNGYGGALFGKDTAQPGSPKNKNPKQRKQRNGGNNQSYDKGYSFFKPSTWFSSSNADDASTSSRGMMNPGSNSNNNPSSSRTVNMNNQPTNSSPSKNYNSEINSNSASSAGEWNYGFGRLWRKGGGGVDRSAKNKDPQEDIVLTDVSKRHRGIEDKTNANPSSNVFNTNPNSRNMDTRDQPRESKSSGFFSLFRSKDKDKDNNTSSTSTKPDGRRPAQQPYAQGQAGNASRSRMVNDRRGPGPVDGAVDGRAGRPGPGVAGQGRDPSSSSSKGTIPEALDPTKFGDRSVPPRRKEVTSPLAQNPVTSSAARDGRKAEPSKGPALSNTTNNNRNMTPNTNPDMTDPNAVPNMKGRNVNAALGARQAPGAANGNLTRDGKRNIGFQRAGMAQPPPRNIAGGYQAPEDVQRFGKTPELARDANKTERKVTGLEESDRPARGQPLPPNKNGRPQNPKADEFVTKNEPSAKARGGFFPNMKNPLKSKQGEGAEETLPDTSTRDVLDQQDGSRGLRIPGKSKKTAAPPASSQNSHINRDLSTAEETYSSTPMSEAAQEASGRGKTHAEKKGRLEQKPKAAPVPVKQPNKLYPQQQPLDANAGPTGDVLSQKHGQIQGPPSQQPAQGGRSGHQAGHVPDTSLPLRHATPPEREEKGRPLLQSKAAPGHGHHEGDAPVAQDAKGRRILGGHRFPGHHNLDNAKTEAFQAALPGTHGKGDAPPQQGQDVKDSRAAALDPKAAAGLPVRDTKGRPVPQKSGTSDPLVGGQPKLDERGRPVIQQQQNHAIPPPPPAVSEQRDVSVGLFQDRKHKREPAATATRDEAGRATLEKKHAGSEVPTALAPGRIQREAAHNERGRPIPMTRDEPGKAIPPPHRGPSEVEVPGALAPGRNPREVSRDERGRPVPPEAPRQKVAGNEVPIALAPGRRPLEAPRDERRPPMPPNATGERSVPDALAPGRQAHREQPTGSKDVNGQRPPFPPRGDSRRPPSPQHEEQISGPSQPPPSLGDPTMAKLFTPPRAQRELEDRQLPSKNGCPQHLEGGRPMASGAAEGPLPPPPFLRDPAGRKEPSPSRGMPDGHNGRPPLMKDGRPVPSATERPFAPAEAHMRNESTAAHPLNGADEPLPPAKDSAVRRDRGPSRPPPRLKDRQSIGKPGMPAPESAAPMPRPPSPSQRSTKEMPDEILRRVPDAAQLDQTPGRDNKPSAFDRRGPPARDDQGIRRGREVPDMFKAPLDPRRPKPTTNDSSTPADALVDDPRQPRSRSRGPQRLDRPVHDQQPPLPSEPTPAGPRVVDGSQKPASRTSDEARDDLETKNWETRDARTADESKPVASGAAAPSASENTQKPATWANWLLGRGKKAAEPSKPANVPADPVAKRPSLLPPGRDPRQLASGATDAPAQSEQRGDGPQTNPREQDNVSQQGREMPREAAYSSNQKSEQAQELNTPQMREPKEMKKTNRKSRVMPGMMPTIGRDEPMPPPPLSSSSIHNGQEQQATVDVAQMPPMPAMDEKQKKTSNRKSRVLPGTELQMPQMPPMPPMPDQAPVSREDIPVDGEKPQSNADAQSLPKRPEDGELFFGNGQRSSPVPRSEVPQQLKPSGPQQEQRDVVDRLAKEQPGKQKKGLLPRLNRRGLDDTPSQLAENGTEVLQFPGSEVQEPVRDAPMPDSLKPGRPDLKLQTEGSKGDQLPAVPDKIPVPPPKVKAMEQETPGQPSSPKSKKDKRGIDRKLMRQPLSPRDVNMSPRSPSAIDRDVAMDGSEDVVDSSQMPGSPKSNKLRALFGKDKGKVNEQDTDKSLDSRDLGSQTLGDEKSLSPKSKTKQAKLDKNNGYRDNRRGGSDELHVEQADTSLPDDVPGSPPPPYSYRDEKKPKDASSEPTPKDGQRSVPQGPSDVASATDGQDNISGAKELPESHEEDKKSRLNEKQPSSTDKASKDGKECDASRDRDLRSDRKPGFFANLLGGKNATSPGSPTRVDGETGSLERDLNETGGKDSGLFGLGSDKKDEKQRRGSHDSLTGSTTGQDGVFKPWSINGDQSGEKVSRDKKTGLFGFGQGKDKEPQPASPSLVQKVASSLDPASTELELADEKNTDKERSNLLDEDKKGKRDSQAGSPTLKDPSSRSPKLDPLSTGEDTGSKLPDQSTGLFGKIGKDRNQRRGSESESLSSKEDAKSADGTVDPSAPEDKKRGLFGLFGKGKDEEQKQRRGSKSEPLSPGKDEYPFGSPKMADDQQHPGPNNPIVMPAMLVLSGEQQPGSPTKSEDDKLGRQSTSSSLYGDQEDRPPSPQLDFSTQSETNNLNKDKKGKGLFSFGKEKDENTTTPPEDEYIDQDDRPLSPQLDFSTSPGFDEKQNKGKGIFGWGKNRDDDNIQDPENEYDLDGNKGDKKSRWFFGSGKDKDVAEPIPEDDPSLGTDMPVSPNGEWENDAFDGTDENAAIKPTSESPIIDDYAESPRRSLDDDTLPPTEAEQMKPEPLNLKDKLRKFFDKVGGVEGDKDDQRRSSRDLEQPADFGNGDEFQSDAFGPPDSTNLPPPNDMDQFGTDSGMPPSSDMGPEPELLPSGMDAGPPPMDDFGASGMESGPPVEDMGIAEEPPMGGLPIDEPPMAEELFPDDQFMGSGLEPDPVVPASDFNDGAMDPGFDQGPVDQEPVQPSFGGDDGFMNTDMPMETGMGLPADSETPPPPMDDMGAPPIDDIGLPPMDNDIPPPADDMPMDNSFPPPDDAFPMGDDMAPMEEPPMEELPMEGMPIEDPPMEQPPMDGMPIEEPLIEEPPMEELPMEEPLTEEMPIEDPLMSGLPIEEPQIEDRFIEEGLPIEEPSMEEPPMEEPPMEEMIMEEDPPMEGMPVEEMPMEGEMPMEEPPMEELPMDEPLMEEEIPMEGPLMEEPLMEEEMPMEEPLMEDRSMEEEMPMEEPPMEEMIVEEEPPMEEMPMEEMPMEEPPMEEPFLEEEMPMEEPLMEDRSMEEEMPMEEPPMEEMIMEEEPPMEEMPMEEMPMEEMPMEEMPMEEMPMEEVPMEEMPMEEMPMEEPPMEEPFLEEEMPIEEPPMEEMIMEEEPAMVEEMPMEELDGDRDLGEDFGEGDGELPEEFPEETPEEFSEDFEEGDRGLDEELPEELPEEAPEEIGEEFGEGDGELEELPEDLPEEGEMLDDMDGDEERELGDEEGGEGEMEDEMVEGEPLDEEEGMEDEGLEGQDMEGELEENENRELDDEDLEASMAEDMPGSPTGSDYGRGIASPSTEENPAELDDGAGQDQEPPEAEDSGNVRLSQLYRQSAMFSPLPSATPPPSPPPGDDNVQQGDELESTDPIRYSHLYRQSIDLDMAFSMQSPDSESGLSAIAESPNLEAGQTYEVPIMDPVPSFAKRRSERMSARMSTMPQTLSPIAASPLSPRPPPSPPLEADEDYDQQHHYDSNYDLERGLSPVDDEYENYDDEDDEYEPHEQDNPGPKCAQTFDDMKLSPRPAASPSERYSYHEDLEQGPPTTPYTPNGNRKTLRERMSGWWSGQEGHGLGLGLGLSSPPPPMPYDSGRFGAAPQSPSSYV